MTRYTPLWLQQGNYPAGTDRALIGAVWPAGMVTGMAVTVSAAMVLNIAPGKAAVPTNNNTGSVLCWSDAVEQVTLTAAPPSGQNRYDLVTVQPRGNDLDGGLNNDWVFNVIAGNPAASPVVPSTPGGQLVVATVLVAGGSASISAGNIADVRVNASGGSLTTVADIVAPNATWNQSPTLTVANAMPGTWLALAQASFAMSTAASSMYGGIKRAAEAAGTNAVVVITNMAVGATVTIPLVQLFTHAGGDLATVITFGFQGGGTQSVLKLGSKLTLVRVGP